MKTEEYWKIKDLKAYLLILEKEDKLKCEVTRSEENDVLIKIKLMEEAQNFGEEKATKEIIEIILKHKNCVRYHYDGEEKFSCLDIVLRDLGYKEKNEN